MGKSAEDYFKRGNDKFAQGDLDGAIADFTEAIRLKPKYALAYNNRGYAKCLKEDFDGAIVDLNEAIRLNPKYAQAYYNRGYAKDEKGDFDGAIADLNEAIRLKPKYALAYNNRGFAKYQKRDLDGAIADYTEAIRLRPKYAQAYNNRGIAKYQREELDAAIADYTEAICLKPKYAKAYYNRGIAKGRKGNSDEAIADFDQANNANLNIAQHFPLLYIAQQTNEIFEEKYKEKRKLFFKFLQKIYSLQKKIAAIKGYGKHPMHFTNLDTLRNLAQGRRFRLYNSSLMNDKDEGKIFFKMLFKENKEVNTDKVNEIQKAFSGEHNNHTFIGSFIMDSDEKDGDDLMWRVYGRHKGRESSGCAFVFDKKTFPSEPSLEVFTQVLKERKSIKSEDVKHKDCFLYFVVYSDSDNDNEEIKKALKDLGTSLDKIHKAIKGLDKQKEMKDLVGGMLDLVRFLFKHKRYASEKEARFVVWKRESSEVVQKDPDLYVECPELNLERVILGPAVKNDKAWKEWLPEQKFFNGKEIDIRKSGD